MTEAERKADAKAAYQALMKFYPFTLDNLDGEEWRPISGYKGYHVSNFGRVKSFNRAKAKILAPVCIAGYLHVGIYRNNKQKLIKVHRLVALAFLPNPANKPEVNHIGGIKFNNHVSNLEWATKSENQKHAAATGLNKPPEGEDAYRAKLTNKQVIYIRENTNGLSASELAVMFGVNRQSICAIQLGQRFKNAGGTIRNKIEHRVPDEIREQIRNEYVANSKSCSSRVLGKKFGLSKTTILNILNEK